MVGATGDRTRSPAALILAGVAVASLLTAMQTFIQQRDTKVISTVYTWLLGRLTVAGWSQVELLLPYAIVATVVLVAHRRLLDVLSVGDYEATSLGRAREPDARHRRRGRVVRDRGRSIGQRADRASSASSCRTRSACSAERATGVILPMSMLLGGAFLVLADIVARQALAPAEIPIGVVTAFFGAPFFVLLLRTQRVVPTT